MESKFNENCQHTDIIKIYVGISIPTDFTWLVLVYLRSAQLASLTDRKSKINSTFSLTYGNNKRTRR